MARMVAAPGLRIAAGVGPCQDGRMQRLHLVVSGRVQGVWYRASARERARALGLGGLARNLEDGRVEVVAEGPREALEALMAWSWEGPRAARVIGVDARWSSATGEFGGFDIAPTAEGPSWRPAEPPGGAGAGGT